MSPRRRLTGIAAMSAVALASAGMAGPAAATEEPEGLAELRALMEAFGGGEMPDEVLLQVLSMYESMGIDPAMLLGSADPELLAELSQGALAFPKVEDATPVDPSDDGAFMKWLLESAVADGDPDQSAFIKLMLGEAGLDDEAFLKLEELAFPKVEDDSFLKLEGEAFLKIEDPLADVESALLEAAAQGALDAETLQSILELLPEE